MRDRIILLIFTILLFPHRASPAAGGIVQGIIADDVGGPLPSARVSVARPDGSVVRSTESGGMGFYLINELPAGTYTLTASHRDFVSESKRVSVVSGKETTVSVQLRARRSARFPSVPARVSAAAQSRLAERESDSESTLSSRDEGARVNHRREAR